MGATEDVIPKSGILDEIQSLVIGASQVVSYKWLSRKYLVSSNAAKRILQEFATQNEGNEVEVVYAISGWSRCEPRTYNIQLVPKFKLQGALEAKREFHGTTCQHVYSVQPRLLNNPAQLLSAEHVQAWELFMQPGDIDNCLRNNCLGSVSCSHVHRGVGGSKSVIDRYKAEPSSSAPLSSNNLADPTTPKSKVHPTQSSFKGEKEAAGKNIVGGAAVKEGSAAKKPTTAGAPIKTTRKNVVTGRKKSGVTGGAPSLANLWDKMLAKVNGPAPLAATASTALVAGNADARIRALRGNCGEWGGDEEWTDFAHIRCCQVNNREGWNQRIVVDDDFSDNEDVVNPQDAINLASPEPFDKKTWVRTAGHRIVTNVDSAGPTGMEIDEEKRPVSSPQPTAVASILETCSNPVESSGSRVKRVVEGGCTGAKQPPGPGRKKGLKPGINERGKGGADVAWETDKIEELPKGEPTLSVDRIFAPPLASKARIERPPTLAKVPRKTAMRSLGKARGKASPNGAGAGQGSLLSFFKKNA